MRKKKKNFSKSFSIVLLIIFLVSHLAGFGHSTKTAKLKNLSNYITTKMLEWNVPGLAICIVKNGKIIFAEGFGTRDIKRKIQVTPQTLFPIGSTTKAFTATAAGILIDEKKLKWDTPVRDILPNFKLIDPWATQKINLLDLLCHRSGLPRHDAVWMDSSETREQLIQRLQFLEPSRDFREAFQYQNIMYTVAGYMIGQIIGSTWEAYIQKKILDPLEMKNTNFTLKDLKKSSNFALPHKLTDGKVIKIPFRDYEIIGPAGSLNSNIIDMSKWLLMNLNQGRHNGWQIISEKKLREIHSPQIVIEGPLEDHHHFYTLYGMGWFIGSYRGHLVLYHGGGAMGFTASVSFLPRDGIGIVILTNLHQTRIRSIIINHIYDAILDLKPLSREKQIKKKLSESRKRTETANSKIEQKLSKKTDPISPLSNYTGLYKNPGYGSIRIIRWRKKLVAAYHSWVLPLQHLEKDIFIYTGSRLKFSFLSVGKGQIHSLAVPFEPAVKDIVFSKMEN